jgi:hypothetical protein
MLINQSCRLPFLEGINNIFQKQSLLQGVLTPQ